MAKVKKINMSSSWIDDMFSLDTLFYGSKNEQETVFAKFLQDYEPFYILLQEIRKKIGITTPLAYPQPATVESCFSLIKSLPVDKQSALFSEAEGLGKRIGATSNWNFPLSILIISHTLPVPSTSQFTLYDPDNKIPLSIIDPQGSPGIIFMTEFSISELHQWVDKISPQLKAIAKKRPKPPGNKNDPDILLLQRIIFILKEFGNKKSEEIVRLLPTIYKKNELIYPYDLGFKEVNDYYNRYKYYLRSLSMQ